MIQEYTKTVTVQDILNDDIEEGVSYIIHVYGLQYHCRWDLFINSEIMFHCDYYGDGVQEEFDDLVQMVVKTKMYKEFKNEDDELQDGIEMSLMLK